MAGRHGDRANAALNTVGNNFRLILKWPWLPFACVRIALLLPTRSELRLKAAC